MDYSILIPVYDEDVTELVHKLHEEMVNLEYSGELIVLDDASPVNSNKEKNRKLEKLRLVFYRELQENVGRSEARNILADLSSGKKLLFLDADVRIGEDGFLKKYLPFIEKENVVVGGHVYSQEKPDPRLLLNWNYAIQYESKPAKERQKNAYRGFISMNFMIPRKWIREIRFPAYLKGWGHEDTLFGYLLERKNLPVVHIDNPVVHLGLSESKVYLKKQREAIHQALDLAERHPGFSYRLMEVHRSLPGTLRKILRIGSGILLPTLSGLCRLSHSPFLLNAYKMVYYNSVIRRGDKVHI